MTGLKELKVLSINLFRISWAKFAQNVLLFVHKIENTLRVKWLCSSDANEIPIEIREFVMIDIIIKKAKL
mgnify:CR=1 FL=1